MSADPRGARPYLCATRLARLFFSVRIKKELWLWVTIEGRHALASAVQLQRAPGSLTALVSGWPVSGWPVERDHSGLVLESTQRDATSMVAWRSIAGVVWMAWSAAILGLVSSQEMSLDRQDDIHPIAPLVSLQSAMMAHASIGRLIPLKV